MGVVTVASRSCGVSRSSHYEYMQHDPEYRKAVNALADVALDFAESQLHKQIKNGSTAATIFYLKTQGKARGYIEKSELDVTSGGQSLAPEPAIDWSQLSPETLRELREAKLKQLGPGDTE